MAMHSIQSTLLRSLVGLVAMISCLVIPSEIASGDSLISISGKLLTAAGTPVPNFPITWNDLPNRTITQKVNTDSSGNYSFSNVPAGQMSMSVDTTNGGNTAPSLVVIGLAASVLLNILQSTSNLNFTLPATGTVHVHVMDSKGNPIQGALVTGSGNSNSAQYSRGPCPSSYSAVTGQTSSTTYCFANYFGPSIINGNRQGSGPITYSDSSGNAQLVEVLNPNYLGKFSAIDYCVQTRIGTSALSPVDTNGTISIVMPDLAGAAPSCTPAFPNFEIVNNPQPSAGQFPGSGFGTKILVWVHGASDGGYAGTQLFPDAPTNTITGTPGGISCSTTNFVNNCYIAIPAPGKYIFTGKTINIAGFTSTASPPISITIDTVPTSPKLASAVSTNGKITLTWTAPTNYKQLKNYGYEVIASPNNKSCVAAAASPIVTWGCVVAMTSKTKLTTTLANLTKGVTYKFWVVAFNYSGISALSAPSKSIKS